MYIEEKIIKGKKKYFLAHSFREGEKVHKIRKLIGTDLSKEMLEERKKKLETLILEEIGKYKIIQDPLDKELSKEELSFIKKLELQADFKVTHLSEKEWDIFSTNFTYNTNAIEGSELTSKEVSGILTENKWPEKSKEDIAEAYGVKEAIKFIRETKEHLSVQLLKEIHKEVFKNSKNFAGEFRKPGQEVVVMSSSGKVVHEGAPQSRVLGLLQNLVDWYNNNKAKYPGIILASVGFREVTPLIVIVSVPAPLIFAPMPFKTSARLTTSGSRAALLRTVVPSASVAAIIIFSVPVTVTKSK